MNVSKNHLIGVFTANSEAQLNIEPEAWGGEFRAQVRVEPLGKLKRVAEADCIIANAGISLVALPSGSLVPSSPVQGEEITKRLLEYFK